MNREKPDYVNDKGTQWWFNQELTDYANEPDSDGTRLTAVGYFIIESEGAEAWVLVDGNSEIIELEEHKHKIFERIDSRKTSLKRNKDFFLPPN